VRKILVPLVLIGALVSLSVAFGMMQAQTATAATPSSGTVSSDSPALTWQGKTFITSNPTFCLPSDPACDTFELTIAAPLPSGGYIVTISIDGQGVADDFDLFVFGPDGEEVGSSATESGDEQVALFNPGLGTYEVVVQAFLVTPGSTYAGRAELSSAPAAEKVPKAKAFAATQVTPASYAAGTPVNAAVAFPGPALTVAARYVGREAAEPTLGVNASGTAFFVAATFDAVAGGLARSEVMRSRDGGKTWASVQQGLLLDTTTEPPTTLDPYLHVDTDTGRVFSIDLYVGCSYLLFSDDEGDTWRRNPLACGQPVNDHHTIQTGPPAGTGLTVGYPNVLYYCFNRVSDSSCGQSLDGGQTFVPAGTAFLGEDPAAGGFCGGLHGHLATDSAGRVFLPKGHCGRPWIAISENGATTFTRVKISDYVRTAHHEVSLAVDAANNVYAVWQDARDNLPYLAVSTDHGRTWSEPAMIAPPGVKRTNFPTITAGDPGRIALTFPGTTSANDGDSTRPWNSYQLLSTNALALADADPTTDAIFLFTTANDPNDPIHRGDCGPGRCGGMLDFLDIQTSPVDGTFWAAASDTCVNECVSDPSARTKRVGDGVAVRQSGGPALVPTAKKKPK
jgi:hypothetical protein